jgi:catechol 2,3-dioxygenase-like lactoylglutathione lyase family enzyme
MTLWNRLIARACLSAVVWMVSPAITAQAADATFHHVHLNAPDPVAAADWYAQHMGGNAVKGLFSSVDYGKMRIIFFKGKPDAPPSKGSAVDHIGFSYKDIHAKLKELADAKVEILSGVEQEGPIKYAFVKDPWGTLIEVVEDPEILGFHHVHLATTDAKQTLQWYSDAFGGQIAKFAGLIPGIRYGDVWLLVKTVKDAPAPTKGRAVDHISWGFADLDADAVRLRAAGVKFNSGPYKFGNGKIAFIEDPLGVLIELVGPGEKK